jgi:hypothetical protein
MRTRFVIVSGELRKNPPQVLLVEHDQMIGRREVTDLMRHFIADYDAMVESRKSALPYMLDRRMWQQDIGMDRFISRAR